ncbi:MAG: CPBP family intramembrane metalloprotease [Acholeplasma sp.]|nr:MAG: CPBP family intramembrane metalloprotease [Acholeplasma sp.]
MKKQHVLTLKEKIIIAILIICVIVFQFINVSELGYMKDVDMIRHSVIRFFSGILLLYLLFKFGYQHVLKFKMSRHSFYAMIPALLIAINNFPIISFLDGRAQLTEPNYRVVLFLIECFSIGFLEELIFRGILLLFLFQAFSHIKYRVFITILISSLVFGLFHITNVFEGAPLSSTILQIGYSFLMGILWASIYMKTGNLWFSMVLHALYNFFGQVMFYLGTVDGRYDPITIAVTVIFATLAAFQVVLLLRKNQFELQHILANNND